MKKSLFRKMLFVALAVTFTSFVACNRYEDDINAIEERLDQLEDTRATKIALDEAVARLTAIESSYVSNTTFTTAIRQLQADLATQASDLAAMKTYVDAADAALATAYKAADTALQTALTNAIAAAKAEAISEAKTLDTAVLEKALAAAAKALTDAKTYADAGDATLLAAINALKASLGDEAGIAKLLADVQANTENVATLTTKVAALETGLATAQQSILTLKEELNAKIDAVDARVNTLELSMTAAETNIANLKESVAALNTQMTAVQGDVNVLDGKVTEHITSCNASITDLYTKMGELKQQLATEVARLEGLIRAGDEEVQGNLDAHIAEYEQAAQIVNDRLDAIEGWMDEFKIDYAAFKEATERGISGNAEYIERVEKALNDYMVEADGKINDLDEKIERTAEDLNEAIEAGDEALDQKIEDLSAELKELIQEKYDELVRKIGEVEFDLNEKIDQEIQDRKDADTALTEKIKANEDAIADLDEKLGTVKDALERQISDLKDIVDDNTERIRTLEETKLDKAQVEALFVEANAAFKAGVDAVIASSIARDGAIYNYVTGVKKDIEDDYNGKFDAVAERIDSLAKVTAENLELIQANKKAIELLTGRVEVLEEDMEQAKKDIQTLFAQLQSISFIPEYQSSLPSDLFTKAWGYTITGASTTTFVPAIVKNTEARFAVRPKAMATVLAGLINNPAAEEVAEINFLVEGITRAAVTDPVAIVKAAAVDATGALTVTFNAKGLASEYWQEFFTGVNDPTHTNKTGRAIALEIADATRANDFVTDYITLAPYTLPLTQDSIKIMKDNKAVALTTEDMIVKKVEFTDLKVFEVLKLSDYAIKVALEGSTFMTLDEVEEAGYMINGEFDIYPEGAKFQKWANYQPTATDWYPYYNKRSAVPATKTGFVASYSPVDPTFTLAQVNDQANLNNATHTELVSPTKAGFDPECHEYMKLNAEVKGNVGKAAAYEWGIKFATGEGADLFEAFVNADDNNIRAEVAIMPITVEYTVADAAIIYWKYVSGLSSNYDVKLGAGEFVPALPADVTADDVFNCDAANKTEIEGSKKYATRVAAAEESYNEAAAVTVPNFIFSRVTTNPAYNVVASRGADSELKWNGKYSYAANHEIDDHSVLGIISSDIKTEKAQGRFVLDLGTKTVNYVYADRALAKTEVLNGTTKLTTLFNAEHNDFSATPFGKLANHFANLTELESAINTGETKHFKAVGEAAASELAYVPTTGNVGIAKTDDATWTMYYTLDDFNNTVEDGATTATVNYRAEYKIANSDITIVVKYAITIEYPKYTVKEYKDWWYPASGNYEYMKAMGTRYYGLCGARSNTDQGDDLWFFTEENVRLVNGFNVYDENNVWQSSFDYNTGFSSVTGLQFNFQLENDTYGAMPAMTYLQSSDNVLLTYNYVPDPGYILADLNLTLGETGVKYQFMPVTPRTGNKGKNMFQIKPENPIADQWTSTGIGDGDLEIYTSEANRQKVTTKKTLSSSISLLDTKGRELIFQGSTARHPKAVANVGGADFYKYDFWIEGTGSRGNGAGGNGFVAPFTLDQYNTASAAVALAQPVAGTTITPGTLTSTTADFSWTAVTATAASAGTPVRVSYAKLGTTYDPNEYVGIFEGPKEYDYTSESRFVSSTAATETGVVTYVYALYEQGLTAPVAAGQTTALTKSFTGLKANTSYTLRLTVKEEINKTTTVKTTIMGNSGKSSLRDGWWGLGILTNYGMPAYTNYLPANNANWNSAIAAVDATPAYPKVTENAEETVDTQTSSPVVVSFNTPAAGAGAVTDLCEPLRNGEGWPHEAATADPNYYKGSEALTPAFSWHSCDAYPSLNVEFGDLVIKRVLPTGEVVALPNDEEATRIKQVIRLENGNIYWDGVNATDIVYDYKVYVPVKITHGWGKVTGPDNSTMVVTIYKTSTSPTI